MKPSSPDSAVRESESRLLRLPAELRNNIYELVAEAECADKAIIFEYAAAINLYVSLAAANHQLKDEYLPVFYDVLKQKKQILAKVLNFDVDALTHFVDNLPPLDRGGERSVEVTFIFKDPEATVDEEAITRWVKAPAARKDRDAGAQVVYHAEVDWSRHTRFTFSALHHDITHLWFDAPDESGVLEILNISMETLRALEDEFEDDGWSYEHEIMQRWIADADEVDLYGLM